MDANILSSEEHEFSLAIIIKAWKRQRGLCAKCGTKLIVANRDQGTVGAWHPHPMIHVIHVIHELRYDLSDNCAILCINPPNDCHRNIGHDPLDIRYYKAIRDWELPYFYDRKRHGYPSSEYKKRLKAYYSDDEDAMDSYWIGFHSRKQS